MVFFHAFKYIACNNQIISQKMKLPERLSVYKNRTTFWCNEGDALLDDSDIITLYWNRDETALVESSQKYGAYCRRIAHNILEDSEDSEECVNDTWLKAWHAMPPQRPTVLSAFLGKITRNLSLDRYKARTAQKRGCGELALVIEELEDCIPSTETIEQTIADTELEQAINRFLHSLPQQECNLFLARYWYGNSLSAIAVRFSLTPQNVKTRLFRIRGKLKSHLEQEGIYL